MGCAMRVATITTAWLTVGVTLVICDQVAATTPIDGVGPAGPVKKVATGFTFTEGPAYRDGWLYFTDIPNERIHRLDASGKVTLFSDKSRHANGLMFTPAGKMLACEMDGQLVEYDLASNKRQVLSSEFNGVRFNAPNDLVIDSHGGVYFTDPRFRAPQPLPQRGQHVYYRSPQGVVSRITPNLPAPNGVLLARDEKTLYVLPSSSSSMWAYDITSPGKVSAGREFCQVTQSRGQRSRGSDGATLDEQGNLYLTTQMGVQIFNEQGQHLGSIRLPEKPSNVTFGGEDGKTLYATARTSVYAMPMLVRGHTFGGQVKE